MDTFLQLRYLVAADRTVKEGNVRRAAKAMHVSPAALLHELHELERVCGLKLFLNDRDRLQPTEAGRAFLDTVSTYLLRHGGIVRLGKDAAAAVRQTLTIGRTPYADPALIAALMNLRLPAYPDLQVHMYSDFSAELGEALKTGKLDLAVIANPGPDEELASVKVSELPFYIALPRTHALATNESVTLRDLTQDRWIIFERKVHPGMYDAILRRAQEDGIVVEQGPHIVTPEEAYQFVSRGVGVAFLNEPSARSLAQRGIPVKPLADSELRIEVYLVWRPEGASQLLTDFVDVFANHLPQFARPPQLTVPVTTPAHRGIVLKHARGEVVLETEKIAWIQAEDYYVAIQHGRHKYLTREPLASLETRLGKDRFIRVHRGALVNLQYVHKIASPDNAPAVVILLDGTAVPLSRRRRSAVARALQQWNSTTIPIR